ncbi:MAG: hypothetical protein R3251_02395 [Candidatus Spechtbacterales bacterium]|nr:hypothetical protein [Candidatus Spechtbacterales bacterium]
MKLKTNLHFHTAEDPEDLVNYTLKEGIDYAAKHGFDVLAVTCHNYFAWTRDHANYAQEKGILLVPGIELTVSEKKKFKWNGHKKGRHVVVVNATKDAESIHTFDELAEYKKDNPDSVIIAAHPYFYGNFSLKKYLLKYIELFDAIEHSWFYSKHFFNRNEYAVPVALENELPMIATSDTHYLKYGHMDRNYAILLTDEKTIPAVVRAIKNGDFENISSPSSLLRHMFWGQFIYQVKKSFLRAIGKT